MVADPSKGQVLKDINLENRNSILAYKKNDHQERDQVRDHSARRVTSGYKSFQAVH